MEAAPLVGEGFRVRGDYHTLVISLTTALTVSRMIRLSLLSVVSLNLSMRATASMIRSLNFSSSIL